MQNSFARVRLWVAAHLDSDSLCNVNIYIEKLFEARFIALRDNVEILESF